MVRKIKDQSLVSVLHSKSTGSPTVELAPLSLTAFFHLAIIKIFRVCNNVAFHSQCPKMGKGF